MAPQANSLEDLLNERDEATEQQPVTPMPQQSAQAAQPEVSTGNSSATQQQPQQQVATVQSENEVLKQIREAIQNNTNPSDLIIPRLAILQAKSPEIDANMPGYKQGMIVDSITRDVLSTYDYAPWLTAQGLTGDDLGKKLHFLLLAPCFKLPTEYIEWIPRNDRKPEDEFPWRFKTLDKNKPEVRRGVWASLGGTFTGKKPPVTDNNNFLVIPIDHKEKRPKSNQTVATFSRTSSKAGKVLATHLQGHPLQGLEYWDRCYWLYTTQEDFVSGTEVNKSYIFNIARGPLLKDVSDERIREYIIQTNRTLSDPQLGTVFQNMMINAAHMDAGAAGAMDHDPEDLNQSSSDDPFTKDAGAGQSVSSGKSEPSF